MAKKTKPVEISVKNLGPVSELHLVGPSPGGLIVLEGGQGVGKSTILRGVSRLLGGKTPDLSAFDGAPRGELAIDEAILRVTRSQHRPTGELEVVGIEGRLNISELVDPGIIDEAKADSARLKALVSLAGVVAKPEMFHDVAGGAEEFDALAIDFSDDIILTHARVKRAFEGKARAEEGLEESTRAKYQATRATFEDLDLDAPCDAKELAAAQDQAVANLATMKAHSEGAGVIARAVETSTRKLEILAQESEDPEELRKQRDETHLAADAANQDALLLQDEVRKLIAQADALAVKAYDLKEKAAQLELRARKAELQAATRATLAEDAARSIPAVYTDEQLAAAEAAVAEARAASERGAVIRRAREQEAAATILHDQSKAHAKRGQLFRDRAASLDAVISSVLPEGCPLRYENGRLVLGTDRGPREPYADLSHGERWKVAIDFVAPIIKRDGRRGLLTLPQEAYESLDDDNKARLAQLAADNELIILTARATHGPLTATVIEAKETAVEGS